MTGNAPKMLEGIRIIDLTTVIFGPYATQMLADLGADVIKVESPTGDISRYLGRGKVSKDMGSVHLTVNRGKKSITLDLKDPEDHAVMCDLIATADVFIHNVRSQAITKLGLDYDALKAIKPDLIYVHGTGFGQNGRYAGLQAYDDVIQAASGTTSLLTRVDGNPRPRYFPSLVADKIAGQFGAQAILAALVHKLRTGEGQHVEVPMFECFTSFMLTEHMRDTTFTPPIGEPGYPRQLDPERQPFPTADGYIAIVPYTDDKFVAVMTLLGGSDVLKREEFSTPLARHRNLTRFYAEMAKLTPARTTRQWLEIMTENDIPAMATRDIADIFDDPHLIDIGFFRPRDSEQSGAYKEMRPPVRYSADPDRTIGIAPRLGADNDMIRQELQRNKDV